MDVDLFPTQYATTRGISIAYQVWGDAPVDQLLVPGNVQDRVTAIVVAAITLKLDCVEIQRVRRKPVDDIDAYDCFLRGMAHCHELRPSGCWPSPTSSRATSRRPRGLVARMIQQDPAMRISNLGKYSAYRQPQAIEMFAASLRLAGMPE